MNENLNYSIIRKGVSSPPNIIHRKLVEVSEGVYQMVEVPYKNPYNGVSADSFSLSSQLASGAKLSPCKPILKDDINSIDSYNSLTPNFEKK